MSGPQDDTDGPNESTDTDDSTRSHRDRTSAVLTQAQREYIRGEKDYRPAVEREVKRRIEDRIQASIFDIELLANEYPLAGLDEGLAEPDWWDGGPVSIPPVERAISSLAALIYLRARDTEEIVAEQDGRSHGYRTALHIRGGIETALTRLGVAAEDISVDIEVQRGEDLETIAEQGDLSNVGRKQLARMNLEGLISEQEFNKAMTQRILSGPKSGAETPDDPDD